MRKRQKLILILYMYAILTLGFLYVPYVRHYPNGVKQFAGHHLRMRFIELTPWDKKLWGYVSIDAPLIIAEILSITAIVVVAFILLKRE